MRLLSLTQPWASLFAIAAKDNETRSWSTPYRGWVAIHAAKGYPIEAQAFRADPRVLRHLPLEVELPRGVVVAVAKIQTVVTTGQARVFSWMTAEELAFGDYSPGRFAWLFEGRLALREPVEVRGMQGLAALAPVDVQRIMRQIADPPAALVAAAAEALLGPRQGRLGRAGMTRTAAVEVPTLDALSKEPQLAERLPQPLLYAMAIRALAVHQLCSLAMLARQGGTEPAPAATPDELITAADVARLMHLSIRQVHRQSASYPWSSFVVRPTPGAVRFRRALVEEYLRDPDAYRARHAGAQAPGPASPVRPLGRGGRAS